MKPSNKPQDLLLNQIISKVTRFSVMRYLYITVILSCAALLMTACSVNGFQVPGVISTETISPTPTATLIPTATEDPFKDFAGKDCTNWEEPCPAKFDDWKSGRLLAYVKTIATPFSEKVMNTEFKMGKQGLDGEFPYFTQKFTLSTGRIIDTCTMFPENNPFKFVAHFFIPDAPGGPFSQEDSGLYFDIAQYKNIDGSSGYLTYFSLKGWRDLLFNKMSYTMPRNEKSSAEFAKKVGNIPEDENIIWDSRYLQVDENKVLIDKWVTTGIIPKELESRVLEPWVWAESCYQKRVVTGK